MSAIKNISTMPIAKLLELKSKFDAEIQSRSGSTSGGGSAAGAAKPKAKRAGSERGTAWASFTKMVTTVHAADFAAFKEAAEVKQGVAPKFVAHYRSTHAGEWEAYNETWKAEHPKDSEQPKDSGSVDDDASSVSSAEPIAAPAPKKRGPKKVADMTPDELAAREAKKAAKKATAGSAAEAAAEAEAPVAVAVAPQACLIITAPAAAAAAAAPDAEEAEVELLPFKLDGQTYIRPSAAGNWASGDLWYTEKDGSKGAYFGELMEDGSINTDAEEPSFD